MAPHVATAEPRRRMSDGTGRTMSLSRLRVMALNLLSINSGRNPLGFRLVVLVVGTARVWMGGVSPTHDFLVMMRARCSLLATSPWRASGNGRTASAARTLRPTPTRRTLLVPTLWKLQCPLMCPSGTPPLPRGRRRTRCQDSPGRDTAALPVVLAWPLVAVGPPPTTFHSADRTMEPPICPPPLPQVRHLLPRKFVGERPRLGCAAMLAQSRWSPRLAASLATLLRTRRPRVRLLRLRPLRRPSPLHQFGGAGPRLGRGLPATRPSAPLRHPMLQFEGDIPRLGALDLVAQMATLTSWPPPSGDTKSSLPGNAHALRLPTRLPRPLPPTVSLPSVAGSPCVAASTVATFPPPTTRQAAAPRRSSTPSRPWTTQRRGRPNTPILLPIPLADG